MDQDPAWMGNPAEGGTAPAAPAKPILKSTNVAMFFRSAHVLIALFMAFTAVLDLQRVAGLTDTESAFVAVYVLLFALLIIVFEGTQVAPGGSCGFIERVLRANFGFLYKPLSKAFFLFFIAFLEFGLDTGNSNLLGILCGLLLLADGVGLGFASVRYPSWFDARLNSSYDPPVQPPLAPQSQHAAV